jgi:uncharacterized protein YyaL (SSP411 family)
VHKVKKVWVLLLAALLVACHERQPVPDDLSLSVRALDGHRAVQRGDGLVWYGWGDEAFRVARRDDRPVLVMIEAEWCQPCVQMHREIVANDELVRLLDSAFVIVALDRDRYPGVDARLQRALRTMTGLSGWPALVLLTPTADPFFGSTYLPASDPVTGRGVLEALRQTSALYAAARKKVIQHAAVVREISWRGRPQPGSIHPALVDSVAGWSRSGMLANAAAASLHFELAQDRGDSSSARFAAKLLEACERDQRLGRSPVPDLLEALAVGLQTAPGTAIERRARGIAEGITRHLTSWRDDYTDYLGHNIAGLIQVGVALDDAAFIQVGVSYLDSLTGALEAAPAGIPHRVGGGDAEPGRLSDYAALAWASAVAYDATGDTGYRERAERLLTEIRTRFGSPNVGAFADAETDATLAIIDDAPIITIEDGIVPNANATAARTAIALFDDSGDVSWLAYAAQILETFAGYPTEVTRSASYGRAVREFFRAKERLTGP